MTIQHPENVATQVEVDPGKILSYLGLSPQDPRSQAVIAVAQRYDLDPLLKHVIIIPRSGVYITRDGLLHVAHRSGQLDGIVVDQEPKLSGDGKEWVARVSVYRKDMGHPFTFPGRYPVNGSNREYAQEMALKAAESHALRRAFDVTGLPTIDEQRETGPQPGGRLGSILTPPDSSPAPADAPEPSAEDRSPAGGQASAGEDPFDYRSGWARGTFFPALRACEDADPKFDAKEFMTWAVGRPITSSKDLTAEEAQQVYSLLPQTDLDDNTNVQDAEIVEEELPLTDEPS